MPTYEYLCTDCDNHWEEVQKISEPALEVCPKCAKSTAKRQISGGNFILKGGGWYADLYSSQPKAKSGGGEKGDKPAAPSTTAAPAKSDAASSSGGSSSGSGSGSGTSTGTGTSTGGSGGGSSGGSSGSSS